MVSERSGTAELVRIFLALFLLKTTFKKKIAP